MTARKRRTEITVETHEIEIVRCSTREAPVPSERVIDVDSQPVDRQLNTSINTQKGDKDEKQNSKPQPQNDDHSKRITYGGFPFLRSGRK